MVALADVLRGWCSHLGARGPLDSRLRGNDVVGCGNDVMGCGNGVVGGRDGVVWVVWGEIVLWFE